MTYSLIFTHTAAEWVKTHKRALLTARKLNRLPLQLGQQTVSFGPTIRHAHLSLRNLVRVDSISIQHEPIFSSSC